VNLSARRAGATALAAVLLAGCGSHESIRWALPEERAEAAMGLVASRDYRKGVTELESLLADYPAHPFSDHARYELGRAYFGLREYALARDAYSRVVADYPNSEWADDARLDIALSYLDESRPAPYDQQRTLLALEELQAFLRDYPDSDRYPEGEAQYMRAFSRLAKKDYDNARLYVRLGLPDAARVYYRSVVETYPGTEWAGASMVGLAELAEAEGDVAEAREQYREFLTDYPDHKLAVEVRQRLGRTASGAGGGGSPERPGDGMARGHLDGF
jgi:outer membrane protein assembly factor BamD